MYNLEDKINPFAQRYNFFTYDPTEEGRMTFEWPYEISEKGVISNWFGGCEPVYSIINRMLKYDGCFYGFPYHTGVGYLFRKDVPRIVFVYTNEYDNEMKRTYSAGDGTKVRETYVVPGATGSTVSFHTRTSESNKQVPPDQYCLDQFYLTKGETGVQKVKDFFTSVTGDDNPDEDAGVAAFKWLRDTAGFKNRSPRAYTNPYGAEVTQTGWHFRPGMSFEYAPSNIDYYALLQVNPFASTWDPTKILTQYQMDYSESHEGKFRGVEYRRVNDKKITSTGFYSWGANTFGFFQLRNTLCTTQLNPVNTYLFVSDANAPRPLYDVPDNATVDEKAKSMYLCGNSELMDDIEETPLPEHINSKLLEYLNPTESNYWVSNGNGGSFTWKTLSYSNNVYHRKREGKTSDYTMYNDIEAVFGGLENPYCKTTMVFGERSGWSSLTKQYNDGSYDCQYVIAFPYEARVKEKKEYNRILTSSVWIKDHFPNDIGGWPASWGQYSITVGSSSINVLVFTMAEFLARCKKIQGSYTDFIGVKIGHGTITNTVVCTIKGIYSSEGFRVTADYNEDDSYVWRPSDYPVTDTQTITYTDGTNVTGTLKIINLRYEGVKSNVATVNGKNLFIPGCREISFTNTNGVRICTDLLCGDRDSNGFYVKRGEYPKSFEDAVIGKAKSSGAGSKMLPARSKKMTDIWADETIVGFVRDFYTNLRRAMPLLMSYRYHQGLS